MHDDFIKKRLESLSIEPDNERTIRNVVEDCTLLREESERLRRENKQLKEQLDYAISNTTQNQNEMTIFANNIKPTPQIEDLQKMRSQSTSSDLYMRKLEEMVRSLLEKNEKIKEDYKGSKNETSLLKDRVKYFVDLNDQFKKAMTKYKTKCQELEEKIKDQGVKVWAKENTGIMRVKQANTIMNDETEGEADIDDLQIDVDHNGSNNDEHPSPDLDNGDKTPEVEKVIDDFALQDNHPDDNNPAGFGDLDQHFPDESTIVVNVDHDDMEDQDFDN